MYGRTSFSLPEAHEASAIKHVGELGNLLVLPVLTACRLRGVSHTHTVGISVSKTVPASVFDRNTESAVVS